MNTQNVSSLFIVCGAFALLSGCSTEPESRLVNRPPPPAPTTPLGTLSAPPAQQVIVAQNGQVVGTTTVVPSSVAGYVVLQAPPAPQPESALARPSPQHDWIPGYWTWQNSAYAWVAGRWEVPPFSGARWTASRWEPEGNSFRFYEGFWH